MISHTVKLLERTFTKHITIVDVYPSLAIPIQAGTTQSLQ